MDSTATDALIIRSDDGSLYAIPRDLLARCLVENSANDEVQGYLNPQPLPPGGRSFGYEALGFAPISFRGTLNSGLPNGIIIVGGRSL